MQRFTLPLAAALAAAALAASGCGGDDDGDGAGGGGNVDGGDGQEQSTEKRSTGGGRTLRLAADAGGALAFDKESLTAPAGKVTLVMDNPSSLPHAVAVEGDGVDEHGETVEQGGVSRVMATLEPGTYEFYCPVAGHEEGGMKGTLTVR